jgi:hypothetical protein
VVEGGGDMEVIYSREDGGLSLTIRSLSLPLLPCSFLSASLTPNLPTKDKYLDAELEGCECVDLDSEFFKGLNHVRKQHKEGWKQGKGWGRDERKEGYGNSAISKDVCDLPVFFLPFYLIFR